MHRGIQHHKLQTSLIISELSSRFCSEHFSSDGVIVTLEWMLLNSRMYYEQLLYNITIRANPQPENVIFIRKMSVQLTLSYNTLYNVSLIQHSTCRILVQTNFLLLSYSKLYTICNNSEMSL